MTIAANNYLPKVACLAESLSQQYGSQHALALCLVERDTDCATAYNASGINRLLVASELGIENFPSFVFRHSLIEAATAIKAQLFLWALENYTHENEFVYLDPDILVYSKFDELEAALQTKNIIVTPHHVNDDDSFEATSDNMILRSKFGVFNLGFLAIKRSPEALRFLSWWNHKLRQLCYVDFARGLFVDQKWIDAAPSFFDLGVLRHPGYNVANWNIAQRKVTQDADGLYRVNDQSMRFFHFSHIDSGHDLLFFKKYLSDSDLVFRIRALYLESTKAKAIDRYGRVLWSYDYFKSGETILAETRSTYRANPALTHIFPDPFESSNEIIQSALPRSGKVLRR